MIFYFNGMGTLIQSDPETLYQGSNKANKIYFVAPFSPTNQVVAQFTLPNGEISNTPLLMTSVGEINGVKLDGEEKAFAIWFAVVPKDLTTYYGNLVCQFNVYDGTGEIAAMEAVNIKIARGAAPALPSAPTTSIYNQLTTALSNLTGRVANLEEWQDFFADTPNILYGNNSSGKQAKIPFSENALPSTIPTRTEQGTLKTATATKDSEVPNLGQVKKIASEAQSLLIEQDLGNAADKTVSQKVITENLNKKLDKTGGIVAGDLAISGNLTVDGKTIISEETTEVVKNAVIILNSDGTDLGTKLAGTVIRIHSNATNNAYAIAYDPATESVKLGIGTVTESGEGEDKTYTFVFANGEGAPVAIRADSSFFTDGHLIKWDSAKLRFVDSGKTVDDIGTGFDKATGIIFPYGTPSVTYDTTDGMTISATFRVTASGANFDIPCDFTIPIFPGEGVSIDANEGNDGIKVNLDGGTAADLQEVLKVVPHTAALAANTSNTTVFLDNVNPSTEIFGSEYGTIFTHKRKWNGKLYDEGYNQLLNKANYPATKTETGVTFTNNEDGTITANGTASANTNFLLQTMTLIKGHKYLLSDSIGKSRATYQTWVALSTGVIFLQTTTENNLAIATCAEIADYTCRIYCRVQSGATVTDITFKPQLIDLTYFENATGKTINTVEDFKKLYPDFYDYVPLPSPSTPLEIVPSGSTSKIISKSVNLLRKEKYGEPSSGIIITEINEQGAVQIKNFSVLSNTATYSLGSYTFKAGHKYLILGGLSEAEPDSIRVGFAGETAYQDSGAGKAFIWSQNTQEKEVSVIMPSGTRAGSYTVKPMIVDLTEININFNLTSINAKEAWLAKYSEFYEGIENKTVINYTAIDSSNQNVIDNAISFSDRVSELTGKSFLARTTRVVFTGAENISLFGSSTSTFFLPISKLALVGSGSPFGNKIVSNFYKTMATPTTSPTDIPDGYIGYLSSSAYINDSNYTTVEAFKAHLAELYAAGTPFTVYYALATPETVEIDSISGIPTIGGQPTIVESQAIGTTNAPVIMDFTNYITAKLNKAYGLLKDNEGNLIVPYGQTNMLYDPNTDEYLSDLLPSKCNRIGKKNPDGTWYSNYYFENVSFTDIKRRQKIEVDVSDPLWEDTTAGTWGIGTLTIGNPGSGQVTTSYYCVVSCAGIRSDTGKLAYIVREVVPAKNPTAKSVRTVAADGTVVWEEYGAYKTIFGNQTITGEGNIDLYEHDIVISGDSIEVLFPVYSSKNIKVDSLTDLKTLCGNTFKKSCTGKANGKVVYGITETNLLLTDGTTLTLANLTFTDDLTTI